MEVFIPKYKYNKIKRYLHELNSTFRTCIDKRVIESHRNYLNEKILGLFTNLSQEEEALLDIRKIDDPIYIDKYLEGVEKYVYGMKIPTSTQINKLFKKEKKLKVPDFHEQNLKHVYLGWFDESIRKLFIVYNMDDKLLGIACRVQNHNSNETNMCTLCNYVGTEDEVGFVSPVCKTSQDEYKSIGFHACLDSERCNERITSTEKLEKLLKNVNNIK